MKHKTHEITLANGAKGLLVDIPDATVMTFEFNYRAGEYLVPREKWETPHLMEHLLLGANELFPRARDFQAEFEKNGAYCNASTSSYDVSYEAECADFEWDRVLGLVILAMTQPLFLAEEFAAEFGNVREELVARSNNHFRYLSLALREQYGFKVMTDQERLKKMDNVRLENVQSHYKITHSTSNLRFVIAGNLKLERRKTIRNLLEELALPRGSGRNPLPDERPRKLAKPLYLINDTIENIYFYVDTFMPRRMRDQEIDALGMANILMTETLHSRIYGTARERGLVYAMSSHYSQTIHSSNWWFGAQVMPKNLPALLDIMIAEITGLRSGKVSKSDLLAAKQYALGRYQRSAQTVGGTAAGYAGRYFFDEVVEDYYKVPERIEAVNYDQMVEIANAMFADDIRGLGVLGNCGESFVKAVDEQIKPLWKLI